MEKKKKKQNTEAADVEDSFDYDQGYNIEEVYDQWIHFGRLYFGVWPLP